MSNHLNQQLIKLVKKAKGDRSITKFAKDSGVSRPYLSQLLNNKAKYSPRPDKLKLIAQASQGRVKYKDLMAAAGYLEGIYYTDKSKQRIENAISEDAELYEFWERMKNRENLQLLMKQTKDLSDEAIKNIINIIKMIEVEEGSYRGDDE